MNPLETYLKEMRDIRSTGAAVAETSFYPALSNLFNEVGKALKPKVRCVINPANTGAGLPDGGLFTADQFQRGGDTEPKAGQMPARGVVEVKGLADDVAEISEREQVARYVKKYGLALVTNYRDFLLLGRDAGGKPQPMEAYTLAETASAFWLAAAHPAKTATAHGERFCEYLKRVMLSNAPLADPKDVAWFLASYARDAKARVESAGELPALATVRAALEEALGMKFTGEHGEHFFRSTLVQTIFYGIFSAWVLWHRERPTRRNDFNWRESAWSLRVPFIRALYDEIATPSKLGPLGLVEVLDWTAAALNRVDRRAFFQQFQDEHAVQYFYEPFLEAFDPELRKELGVWLTPPEIAQYQVARVDIVLREELGLPDGLADPNVFVLDPCCGTAVYLMEVLKRIAETLKAKGGDGLIASDLKKAAMTRIFGFEILPAPFVVAHLQLGLMLARLGAPLSGNVAHPPSGVGAKKSQPGAAVPQRQDERVGVYLTNSLTGWEPPKEPKNLLFPELQAERDAADRVKQTAPVLVILGNPAYNGFADVAVEEERDLSLAYRTTTKAPPPQGQGLNDLYVRFFRVAERRIVEKTGKGVVCYISNYSWLDGLSHTGMRERYIEAFDRIWIDCLNGDKYKTGKLTPDGQPDPSVFSTETNREGIQVGTAIALMVRKEQHTAAKAVHFRHLWGKEKRAELLASADNDGKSLYETLTPQAPLGFPFMPSLVGNTYLSWPLLPGLLPVSFAGVKTSRDDVVVDIDRDRLVERMQAFYDPKVTDEAISHTTPRAMLDTPTFNAKRVRQEALRRGFDAGNLVRYSFRPFDVQWVYWDSAVRLMDRPRPEYVSQVRPGNLWLSAGQHNRKADFYQPQFTTVVADLHLVESNVTVFPLVLYPVGEQAKLFGVAHDDPKPNLSEQAVAYLDGLGYDNKKTGAEALFFHVLAMLHAPAYSSENAGALRQDWPRVPLPATREALEASAALGRQLAALLDPLQPVNGITTGKVRPEVKPIGLIARVDGKQIDADSDDLAVTAGWAHAGRGGITMPAGGKVVERPYSPEESITLGCGTAAPGCESPAKRANPDTPEGGCATLLGPTTFDIYLNDNVCWRNIPAAVWGYTLGGYQVIKKWLSYRESKLLGRSLRPDEARYVTEMARRIAAILLLQPALDENYRRAAASAYAWPTPTSEGATA